MEDLDPLTTETLRETNRGILVMMVAALGLATVAGFAFAGTRFGVGVLLGGGIAFINYYWLDRSTTVMMKGDALESTATLAIKYVLRYFAIGALLMLIFWTGVLPVTAVIIGLGIFAIAVVAQGVRSIFKNS